MKLRGGGKRYAHYYNGKATSRGARFLSKLYKGMKVGDVQKAFKELDAQKAKKKE